ncbi:H-NS histone family protein [Roseateles sp. NT4]|uniref:H-NS histone family protein n=1 Tax=Roseateles sp. NT4 TaxID=3453715 RepID=UPI003EEF316E
MSTILSQIERLQKEATAIQSEVVDRIRKDIAKFGLTAEQLFGETTSRQPKARPAAKTSAKGAKYADGSGNTWGGMGKRPDWLRQALTSGKTLEDFLVGRATASATPAKASRKRVGKKKVAAPRKRAAAAKRAPAKDVVSEVVASKKVARKKAPSRKPRAKPVAKEASVA